MAISKTTKVWKTNRTSAAGMVVTDNEAMLIGSQNNLVVADGNGITIAGPVSIVSDAINIRRGGLFVGINDFLDMIPSTLITPIPKQIPMPPIHGVMNLAKDVAFFLALLV